MKTPFDMHLLYYRDIIRDWRDSINDLSDEAFDRLAEEITEYAYPRTHHQAPVVEVSREDCVRIATELQKISETIGESLHPEKFKSEAEMMAFYEQVKGKEIEAHAEAIHALLQSKGGR